MRRLLYYCFVILACMVIQSSAVDLGKIGDLTWTGSGTEFYSSFGSVVVPDVVWTDTVDYASGFLYEMELTNTTQTLDTGGGGSHGDLDPSVAGGPSWTIAGTNQNGRVEHDYDFDGVDDRVKSPIVPQNTGSMGCWFNHDDDPPNDNFIMGSVNSAFSQRCYMLRRNNSGEGYPLGGALGARDDSTIKGTTPLSSNTWYFGVMTWDGSNTRLYLNGTEEDSDAQAGTVSPEELTAGAMSYQTGHLWFDGSVDHAFYTTNVLDQTAITNLYDNTHPTNNIRNRTVAGWSDPNTYAGLWEFETTNTTQTLDTSGNGFDASNKPSVASGASWVEEGWNQTGRVEHVYSFDGFDSFQIGDEPDFDGTTSFSVGAWVHNIDNNQNRIILQKYNGTFGWQFYLRSNGEYSLYANGTGGLLWGIGTGGIDTNEWEFVVAVIDRTSATDGIKLYVDAVEVQSTGDGTAVGSLATSVDYEIGGDQNGTFKFYGKMDMPFYITNAISAEAVTNLYLNTNPKNNIRIR